MTVVYGTRGECRWCHAPVLWLEHERTGKKAPIDADPTTVSQGNINPLPDGTHYRVVARPAERDPRVPWHLNHWMTCPNATHLRARVAAEQP